MFLQSYIFLFVAQNLHKCFLFLHYCIIFYHNGIKVWQYQYFSIPLQKNRMIMHNS